jgi:hypothetical protein
MNNMNQTPLLLVVTAENCGACVQWKQSGKYGEMVMAMRNSGLVEVKEVPLKKRGDSYPGVPEDVRRRLVKWYPVVILVTRSSWNRGTTLSAAVYNGVMNSKTAVPSLVPDSEYQPLDAAGVGASPKR